MDINYGLYKVFYQVALTLSFSEASKKEALYALSLTEQLPKRQIVAAINTMAPISHATEAFLSLFS